MDEKEMITVAKERVKEKKVFYGHFNIFLVVSFTLFLVNYVNSYGDWWVHKPLILWAMFLGLHFFHVFKIPDVFELSSLRNKIWEEEQLEKELEKLEKDLTLTQEQKIEKNEDRLELEQLLKKTKRKTGEDEYMN